MKKKYFSLILLLALILLLLSQTLIKDSLDTTTQEPAYTLDNNIVLGRVENVYYSNIKELEGVPYVGKIDTGADTTSMHAENIEVISQNPKYKGLKNEALLSTIAHEFGKLEDNWWLDNFDTPERNINGIVKFTLRHPYTGDIIHIEKPLARLSAIRSRTSKEPIYRPVINIPLTIAGKTVDTDVNLTDRSHFSAPILIGKSFLSDNAWVAAGYDYLQEQPNATIIGKKETVYIKTHPIDVSFSLVNRYSSFHATNIQVNDKAQRVRFSTEDNDGKKVVMTLPLVRMLRVSGEERPLVYLPITFGDTTQNWLVYLRDRSKSSTKLRVGRETLNQHFVINTKKESQLSSDSALQTYQDVLTNDNPFIVSGKESIQIEGVTIPAEPSLFVHTPVLKVDAFNITESEKNKKESVSYTIIDHTGNKIELTDTIVKKINVAQTMRPVIKRKLIIGEKEQEVELALEVLDDKEKSNTQSSYFIIGQQISSNDVLINTRTENLLESYPQFKVGHIEMAEVSEMRFPVKLDTGADVSSMNAIDIKRFEKDGKPMVTFTYQNDLGDEKTFTREVVDTMTIKAKAGEKPNIRPVVEMTIKLGHLEKTIPVNLQDRSRFHYSMILGKNFLKYGAIVSSDQNFFLGEE